MGESGMNALQRRRERLNALMPVQETRNMLSLQAMMDNAPVGAVGAPGGLQPNPRGPTGRDPITEGLQMSSFVPVVGDAAGFAGDVRMMAKNPEARTLPNALMTLAGVLPFIPGITAFHGSPHKFDAFDMKHIGKGEGAQAYGHGLYFAESPGVAKSYQVSLSRYGRPDAAAQEAFSAAYPPGEAVIGNIHYPSAKAFSDAYLRNYIKASDVPDSLRKELDRIEGGGAFYEVDIPDEAIDRMLDWDAPLSEQPEIVRDAINRVAREPESYGLDKVSDDMRGIELKKLLNSPQAVKRLNELGVTGIKYYDGMSRTSKKGTRNFVVFDDQLPKVLKRE